MSKGEYLLFLDADDWLHSDHINSYLKSDKESPPSIVYGPWKMFDLIDGKYELTYTQEQFESKNMLSEWLRGWWWIPPCCIMWPREIYTELGEWDEQLTANQDGDLAMRALVSGFLFRYCAGKPFATKVRHRSEKPSISDDKSLAALRSRLAVLNKIANLLRIENLFESYRDDFSAAYYSFARCNALANPDFSHECYRLFRSINRFGKPPGSFLNWVMVLMFGLRNKEKIAEYFGKIRIRRNSVVRPD